MQIAGETLEARSTLAFADTVCVGTIASANPTVRMPMIPELRPAAVRRFIISLSLFLWEQ
jgi:hypothetical protein